MKIPCAEIPKASDEVFLWMSKELLKFIPEQSKYHDLHRLIARQTELIRHTGFLRSLIN